MNTKTAEKIVRYLEKEPIWQTYYGALYEGVGHKLCFSKLLVAVEEKLFEMFGVQSTRQFLIKLSLDKSMKGKRFDWITPRYFHGSYKSGSFTGPCEGYMEINQASGFVYDCFELYVTYELYRVMESSSMEAFYKIIGCSEEEKWKCFYEEVEINYTGHSMDLLSIMEYYNEFEDMEVFDVDEIIYGACYFCYLSGEHVPGRILREIKRNTNFSYYNTMLLELLGPHYLQTTFRGRNTKGFLEGAKEYWELINLAFSVLFDGLLNDSGCSLSCFCFSSKEVYAYLTHDRELLSLRKQKVMDRLLSLMKDPIRTRMDQYLDHFYSECQCHLSKKHQTATFCFAFFEDEYSIMPEASIASGLFHLLYHQYFHKKGEKIA